MVQFASSLWAKMKHPLSARSRIYCWCVWNLNRLFEDCWSQNSIIVHNVNTLNVFSCLFFCIYYYFYEFLMAVTWVSAFSFHACPPVPHVPASKGLCCHTRLVFLCAMSLSESHKYFIVVQIITCYCYYVEIMVITYKDKWNKWSIATCSLVNLLLK